MRRIGVATLALIATGCSILIDSDKYTGGDAGPDAGVDAPTDGAVDASDGGCTRDDECDRPSERCQMGMCVTCHPECTPTEYCDIDGCRSCDDDSDGYSPRPDVCGDFPAVEDCADDDPTRHPGRLVTCDNSVFDDCRVFPLAVQGFEEVGALPTHMLDSFDAEPVQLSVSTSYHRFSPGDVPWEAVAVVKDGDELPTVTGFDLDPIAGRSPRTEPLVQFLDTDVMAPSAAHIDDIQGLPYLVVAGIAAGSGDPAAVLFVDPLAGAMFSVDRIDPRAVAVLAGPEAAGSLGVLARSTDPVDPSISAVWHREDRLERVPTGSMVALASGPSGIDTTAGVQWMASDRSLVVAPQGPPSAGVVLWRGESGVVRALDFREPGTTLLGSEVAATSGAVVHLDGLAQIYLVLVPTVERALFAWYLTCLGGEGLAACTIAPESVDGLGADPEESIERAAAEMLREIEAARPAQVVAATSVRRASDQAIVLRGLEVSLPAAVTPPDEIVMERSTAELPFPVTITRVHAIATALRNVVDDGDIVGTDLVVTVAIDSGAGRQIWTSGARFCVAH